MRDHPPHEGDGGVVVDVEEGHLLEVVLQEHDEGVEELVHLAHVEDPDVVRQRRLLGVVGVAPDVVAVPVRLEEAAAAHVQGEDDEENVVEDDEGTNPEGVLRARLLGLVAQHSETSANHGEVEHERGEQDRRALDRDPVLRHGADGMHLPIDRLRSGVERSGRVSVAVAVEARGGTEWGEDGRRMDSTDWRDRARRGAGGTP